MCSLCALIAAWLDASRRWCTTEQVLPLRTNNIPSTRLKTRGKIDTGVREGERERGETVVCIARGEGERGGERKRERVISHWHSHFVTGTLWVPCILLPGYGRGIFTTNRVIFSLAGMNYMTEVDQELVIVVTTSMLQPYSWHVYMLINEIKQIRM